VPFMSRRSVTARRRLATTDRVRVPGMRGAPAIARSAHKRRRAAGAGAIEEGLGASLAPARRGFFVWDLQPASGSHKEMARRVQAVGRPVTA
jgi:hypothetical protein